MSLTEDFTVELVVAVPISVELIGTTVVYPAGSEPEEVGDLVALLEQNLI